MTELPTTFGKYYLTEKLATGGMAEIYLAKLIGPGGFEKQLVIKQIHPTLSGQRPFVDLFVAEAKTLVTLAHGNIVPVYELGVVDETYYIAMDYIDGPTLYRLTEIMARRDARMAPALAAYLAARILEGLDYAHRKGEGVIHRDLSPRNVMLSRDGEVKLVDFGIAVTLGGPEIAGRDSAPTGSFPYMSPEQARRESLTPQTDLFSVGVLLWEMLTGERLFHRADAEATLRAVESDPIRRPSSVRPEVPAKLDDVVMRALERDRAARWPTAADMLGALQKYLYALDETPGPRDVAAIVARFCPPESRRLPTHADTAAETAEADTPAGPSTAVIPRPSGPSTAVVPRGRPQRHTSFATNIDLAPILAADDAAERSVADAGPATQDVAPANNVPTAGAASPQRDDASADGATRAKDVASAPGRSLLLLAGIGAIGLAVAAVVVFVSGRDAVMGSNDAGMSAVTAVDPAGTLDGAPSSPDASREVSIDAGAGVDRTTADAATRVDAGARVDLSRRADAGARIDGTHRGDAGSELSPADASARATGTLQIGADPWGDILVDGAPMGRTPKVLVVGAGHHTVEIVFPAESPPRKQTFSVDVGAGETKPLQADFN